MQLLTRTFATVHLFLYRLTNGRLGDKIQGRDVLLLKTVGRKSGKLRVKPIAYVPDGDDYLVLGGAGGAKRHPAWYWNAVAESSPVEIQIKDATFPVHVTELHGEERDRAYTKIKQAFTYELIEGYERKAAGRLLPVLRLTPQKP